MVFSRFGVMFFDDAAAAFRNLHCLLRPGGRLGFSCWQGLFANEWLLVPGMAIVALTGEMPPMDEDAPGPFLLANPEHVHALLTNAGFEEISIQPHTTTITVARSELDAFAHADLHVGSGAALLANSDSRLRANAERAVRDALAERLMDGQVHLTAAALLVRARRS